MGGVATRLCGVGRVIDAVNGTRISVIVIVALIAVLLTLPSMFEIPLALSVLAAGGPAGAAAALLFAGPAINLPSLLVIGRYSSWKVAAGAAGLGDCRNRRLAAWISSSRREFVM